MYKVEQLYRTKKIKSWEFNNKREAEEFINEKLTKIGEGYGEEIVFTRREEKNED